MPHHSHHEQPLEEESYFVSMTDMMVGLLFIFILILMYFALQYQKSTQDLQRSTEKLQNAEDTRERIIQEIADNLKKNNVSVRIDLKSGVLHLPDEILRFARQDDEIETQYEYVVKALATSLMSVVPCYAQNTSPKPSHCHESAHRLESIFIEGHTDSDIYNINGKDYNWELSTNRAVNTYRKLVDFEPNLENVKNDKNEHLLSISGYGSKRPLVDNDTDEHKRINRRIDLRFIMATPKSTDSIENIKNSVQDGLE